MNIIKERDVVMALIDRIKYDGPSNGMTWLVHKYSSEQFVLGSQLIVNQSQEALFFKGGEALDLFGPGTHTLKTGNLPILNKLVNLPFGGKTPFSAEVYYVNKVSKLDLKWGTTNPIPFEDPKYGLLLSIRAHGQYGLRISDTRLFVSQIIGVIASGSTADYTVISKYFNGIINSKIKDITAKTMIKEKISFLEITAYLDKLSSEYKKAIDDEFERFGIEIINFYVKSISPPQEEYEKLRGYKEELALGEKFYTTRRTFDVMEKMSENPSAGGMANAGIGLGMGLGAAGALYKNFDKMANSMSIEEQSVQNFQICPCCNAKVLEGMKFCSECGSKIQNEKTCSKCGSKILGNVKYCGECGQSVGNIRCPKCNTENLISTKFCGNCGEKL